MPGDGSSTTTKSTEPDPSPEDEERQEADLEENGVDGETTEAERHTEEVEEDDEVEDAEGEEGNGNEEDDEDLIAGVSDDLKRLMFGHLRCCKTAGWRKLRIRCFVRIFKKDGMKLSIKFPLYAGGHFVTLSGIPSTQFASTIPKTHTRQFNVPQMHTIAHQLLDQSFRLSSRIPGIFKAGTE